MIPEKNVTRYKSVIHCKQLLSLVTDCTKNNMIIDLSLTFTLTRSSTYNRPISFHHNKQEKVNCY